MKLRHTQSREGRRGGKLFNNGRGDYLAPYMNAGVYNSTGRHDRRPGKVANFHGHATTGRPSWAR